MSESHRCMGERHINNYQFKIEKGTYCPECAKLHRKAIKAARENIVDEYGKVPYPIELLIKAKPGTPIYCNLRHVSRSGMFRLIDVYIIHKGQPVYLMALTRDKRKCFSYDFKREGFKMSGCGMDMGFALVYDIGQAIHGNGYYFKKEWL